MTTQDQSYPALYAYDQNKEEYIDVTSEMNRRHAQARQEGAAEKWKEVKSWVELHAKEIPHWHGCSLNCLYLLYADTEPAAQ